MHICARGSGFGPSLALLAAVLVLWGLLAGAAAAQAQPRAEPITGPGITTIGHIAPGSYVTVRAGPSTMFPSVGALGYGTQVRKGVCAGGGSARWCHVSTMDGAISGFVGGRYLVEGAARPPDSGDSDGGGPDFWVVRGLPPGDRLNVRREPSARAQALATLSEGEVVRNLGCRREGQTRWCRIRSTVGMDVTGWVAGRYLREAAGPAPVPTPPPPPGVGGSGPDAWLVTGLAAGDLLNLRAEPSTQAPVLARLMAGDRLQNLGCRAVGQTRWCRVRTLTGADVTGWVNGRYLREP